MVLMMANPTKMPTGVYYFVQRVPTDLIGKVGRKVYSYSLQTKDPKEARARFIEEAAKKEREHAALRSAPSAIPHKELLALAGKAYQGFVAARDEEPGEETIWAAYSGLMARLEKSGPEVKERWFGEEADRLLMEAGKAADDYSRRRLIDELHKAYRLAGEYQARRAGGDYSPDTNAARFPAPAPLSAATKATPSVAKGKVTITQLFEWWKLDHTAKERAPATVDEYESKTNALIKWLGHDDAVRVTGENLSDYLDHMQQTGLSLKTIADKYLPHIKAIFRAASDRQKITTNPAHGLKRTAGERKLTRGPGYTDAEASTILLAANKAILSEGKHSAETKIACRWVPWVCAYTGARVNEITQLRKQDVYQEHGIWLINITPEAGTVKNRQYRLVPIHPHLVEMGFLDFVRSHADGPLFYQSGRKRRGEKSSQAENVGSAVGTWVRSLFDPWDTRLRPNHAWRHRFKTVGRDVGMELHYLDMLQGHADGRASTGYGETTIKALDREMRKIPAIKVD